MKDKHNIKQVIYLKNDKMFNQLLMDLYNIKNYIQLESEPKDEQEKHLYYMIETEIQNLTESIEILKDKRTNEYYKNN